MSLRAYSGEGLIGSRAYLIIYNKETERKQKATKSYRHCKQ